MILMIILLFSKRIWKIKTYFSSKLIMHNIFLKNYQNERHHSTNSLDKCEASNIYEAFWSTIYGRKLILGFGNFVLLFTQSWIQSCIWLSGPFVLGVLWHWAMVDANNVLNNMHESNLISLSGARWIGCPWWWCSDRWSDRENGGETWISHQRTEKSVPCHISGLLILVTFIKNIRGFSSSCSSCHCTNIDIEQMCLLELS